MKLSSIISILLVFTFSIPAFSQEKQHEKITQAIKVVNEFAAMKDKVPAKLLNISQGIIIVPKLINAGLGIGGKRGKGVALVRNEDGSWSNPVFVTMTGGSFGFQAGVQSVDLVLVFTNRETLKDIGKGSFTLGGDASVTAGPVGRNASANTDIKFESEVYSYSKSKGLFAGISISGSALDIDEKAIEKFYGEEIDAKTLFESTNKENSLETLSLLTALRALYK